MTYCKDCRTEFMVEADDPCPRCGRFLGGARKGQRAETEQPEQAEQPAALPTDEPPRLLKGAQASFENIADGCVSLLVRQVLIMLLAGMLLAKVLSPSMWLPCMVALAVVMVVVAILSKTSQRAAQTWRPAGESTASASLAQTTQPAAAQQLSASPSAPHAPIDEPSRPPRSTQAIAEDIAVGGAVVIMRLMLLAVLAIPAGIGFGLLLFYQGRRPAEALLWFLYVSVFAPIVCFVFTPVDELDDLMRDHPWFCVIVLLWVFLATGLFLWGMSDPNTFRIFLSVFGGGYY